MELEPNWFLAHDVLGRVYVQKSKYIEGVAEFEKALASSPGNPDSISSLGYPYAIAGRRAEAQKVLDQLNQQLKRKYVPTVDMAIIYTGLGDKDKAFEWLEKSYDDGSVGTVFGSVKVDPIWDPLRSDPRFTDLLRRMNLAQ